MRLRVPALLLTVAAVAGALLVAGPAAAAPASYDALLVDAEYDRDPAAAWGTRAFEKPEITVTNADVQRFAASGDDGAGHTASVSFRPPVGRTLTAGAYFNLLDAPTSGQGAGVVTYGAASCVASYGLLKIDEGTSDADGALTSLAGSFEIRCDGHYLTGLLRFHAQTGWATMRSTVETPDLGNVRLGTSVTRTVPLTIVGQGDAIVTQPGVYGSQDSGASLVSTTCAETLHVGDTCDVVIRFAPRTAFRHHVRLVAQDDPGFYFTQPDIGLIGTGIDTPLGTYYPTGPTRVLDTRTTTGGHLGALGPRGSVVVHPDTDGAAASAYVLNLTAVTPSASGYLTAYPTGKPVPATASVNVAGGRTVAHLITVPAGAGGAITVRNAAGTTHVVADLVGWYSADDGAIADGAVRGGGYHRGGVQRLLDTRTTQAVPAHQYVTVSARYPGRHVAALAVNVTVTAPLASGYVTAWNAATDTPPLASTLNFNRGETVSNAAIIPASACTAATGCTDSATIGIANGSGSGVHVIVDITGYFDDGGVTADVRFHPLPSPTRVVDTRQSLGTTPFAAGATHAFLSTLVGPDTVALDGDVTAVRPTRSTYLTVWPATMYYQRPRSSTVNAAPGQVVGNHVLAAVGGEDGAVNVYNFAGDVDVVADVDGTFDAFPSVSADGIQYLRDAFLPTSDSPVGPVYRPVA